ncbi:hypothetical protein N7468_007458 [Penicillium chermesinum]|uniref:Cyclase n=1 Tax=Penicillium chermesinum TaxID=63820 RepID=A0A9W9TKP2_9EURO|nr:uncharacterized protein N7468_007458 [Penicillium chermesinum]KAJ5226233.1 hypothetical protein N7468_007458 [Penicillium chermesinum]
MSGPLLPEKFDDLPDKRRHWPGKPGSEDEGLGMLRLLTPDVVANAAKTQIQTGDRVCLNWNIENLTPPVGRAPTPQRPSPIPEDPNRRLFYGGTTASEIIDSDSPRIGIGHWAKKGIAGRGVLIDYVRYAAKKGKPINALTRYEISLDEVIKIARESNITFQQGDIFFLRVGLPATWAAMSAEQRKAYSQQSTPQHAGIEQSERVLRFLWDNHFAAVASDAVSFEVFPAKNPEFDLHHYLLAGWGVPIGEMFDLDELAKMCERLGRWSFFISSSPLNCARGGFESAELYGDFLKTVYVGRGKWNT